MQRKGVLSHKINPTDQIFKLPGLHHATHTGRRKESDGEGSAPGSLIAPLEELELCVHMAFGEQEDEGAVRAVKKPLEKISNFKSIGPWRE